MSLFDLFMRNKLHRYLSLIFPLLDTRNFSTRLNSVLSRSHNMTINSSSSSLPDIIVSIILSMIYLHEIRILIWISDVHTYMVNDDDKPSIVSKSTQSIYYDTRTYCIQCLHHKCGLLIRYPTLVHINYGDQYNRGIYARSARS